MSSFHTCQHHLHDCSQPQHCCQNHGGTAVHQTLDELEFERGIWGAAQTGELERVYKLIQKGADANRCDNSGYTALHYAARNGYLEICKVLLQNGANVNSSTRAGLATALHRACTAGHIKIVQLLLSNGANIEMQDGDGKTALHRAAEKGHEDIYNLLQLNNLSNFQCKDNKGKVPSDYLM